MKNKSENNLAFIDGQNLHLSTAKRDVDAWKIDHKKLRVYLKDKYHVTKAFYLMGYFLENHQDLYRNLEKAGFTLLFKEHRANLLTEKKGNVDNDIIFHAMENLVDNKDFNKIVIISGDGDYKKLVCYFLNKGRFKTILLPNSKRASSLYNSLGREHFDYLDSSAIRSKIEHK